MRFYKRNIVALVVLWVLFAVALYVIILVWIDEEGIYRLRQKERELNAHIKDILQSKEITIPDSNKKK